MVTPQTFTVDQVGELVEVMVENPIREIFGTLEVTKDVTGDTAGLAPGSTFGFTLDCADDAFDTTFTLTDGQTFTSDPIRIGVECTLVEGDIPDPAPEFIYRPPTFSPSATVTLTGENQVITVNVENELAELVGRFEVVKVLSGDVEGHVEGSTFGFTLDCDDDTFDTTFDLDTIADTFTSVEMPVGTTCTVEEQTVPAAAAGFTYEDPVYSPDPPTATITSAGQTVTMQVDNPLTGPSAPGPSPSPSPSPPGIGPTDAGEDPTGSLPDTGGRALWLLVAGSCAVLVGGGLLLVGVGRRP